MLVKEYRILLPLTVDEYRIAQLYMIQKKSRIDSSGAGSGVEIVTNEPYTNGFGGSGQYTYKIYHIGNKIPAWIRSVLPSNALEAHEEAWNAYPFTRTRYTCPLMDRFLVEVETHYINDAGVQDNVFNLSADELKNRVIDVMDFVNDPVSNHDYCVEEDPKIYKSEKTNRGPLIENWVSQHVQEGRSLMCAYKICRVEFRYWGLQTRAERWIHDLALRGTMLRAHRQAWAWQDEWVDLTMTDIRRLEEDAALYLSNVMSPSATSEKRLETPRSATLEQNKSAVRNSMKRDASNLNGDLLTCSEKSESAVESENEEGGLLSIPRSSRIDLRIRTSNANNDSGGVGSDSEDVFFDCYDHWSLCAANKMEEEMDQKNKPSIIRWSSELLLNNGEDDVPLVLTPKPNSNSSLLILVFHGDVFPDNPADMKTTDANSFNSTLEHIVKNHYPQLKGKVQVLQVTCGKELVSTFAQIKSICPHSSAFHPSFSLLLVSDEQAFEEAVQEMIKRANEVVHEFLNSEQGAGFHDVEIFTVGDCVGGLLMYEALAKPNDNGGEAHRGHPQVVRNYSSTSMASSYSPYEHSKLNNASTCSLFEYDVNKGTSLAEFPNNSKAEASQNSSASLNSNEEPQPKSIIQKVAIDKNTRNLSAPPSASYRPSSALTRFSTSSIEANDRVRNVTLAFKSNTAFLLGCPLSLVLMQKKLSGKEFNELECEQLFNLYYPLDLCGGRLEPVLNAQLAALPAMSVPRYQRSKPSGTNDDQQLYFDNVLETPILWGNRRVDYQLYCPSEMVSLPSSALPNILHASYWESKDVGEFILRQFVRTTTTDCFNSQYSMSVDSNFSMDCEIPVKAWKRRRTRFKIANLSANHRANDLILVEDSGQDLVHARFCYGPMDLVALSHENILVYVCPQGEKWYLNSTEVTDAHGRVNVRLNQALPIGIHSIRMIVQGDRSFLNLYVAVVPPDTECVVFSIDGSLTGSVSVTGRDPRVKPGAVDVVRYWQQQGYLIIYVTARPDMQQRLVAHWLAQHNFPHGLLFFTPSFSTDPLKQKAQLLRHLIDQCLKIYAAYGSAKDISVYSSVGVESEHIFKVGSHSTSKKRYNDCVALEDGYAHHLHSLHCGEVRIARPSTNPQIINLNKRIIEDGMNLENRSKNVLSTKNSNLFLTRNPRSFIHRTDSFTPRSGKYASFNSSNKKGSQISISTR